MNKFTLDQVVVYNGNTFMKMLAEPGAMGKVKGFVDGEGRMLVIEWMDMSQRNGQPDGQYMADSFDPVPPASEKPWFSFTIQKETLRKEVFLRGYPAVVMQLHAQLQGLIDKILSMPDEKVDPKPTNPADDPKQDN